MTVKGLQGTTDRQRNTHQSLFIFCDNFPHKPILATVTSFIFAKYFSEQKFIFRKKSKLRRSTVCIITNKKILIKTNRLIYCFFLLFNNFAFLLTDLTRTLSSAFDLFSTIFCFFKAPSALSALRLSFS